MITEKEKTELKEVLGNHYTASVLEVLNKQGALSSNGTPYTGNMVRRIFNGNREHKVIEAAIYKAYQKEKASQEAEAQKRKNILKTT